MKFFLIGFDRESLEEFKDAVSRYGDTVYLAEDNCRGATNMFHFKSSDILIVSEVGIRKNEDHDYTHVAANAFYMMGVAHAVDMPVMLVSDSWEGVNSFCEAYLPPGNILANYSMQELIEELTWYR